MRVEQGQYGYIYGIEIPAKNFEHDQNIFYAVSWPRNLSGIDTDYDAGLYGWTRVDRVLIPYGPGKKSGYVWL